MGASEVEEAAHLLVIRPPEENMRECELCGKYAELRPYGPNGESVCFDCGMKDEEETGRQFFNATKIEIESAVDQVLDEQEMDAVDFGDTPLKSLKPVGEPTPVDWAIRHCETGDEEQTRLWDSYEQQDSEEWKANFSPPLSKEDVDEFERLVVAGGYGIDCDAVVALLSPYMSNIETHTTDINRWYRWLHGDED